MSPGFVSRRTFLSSSAGLTAGLVPHSGAAAPLDAVRDGATAPVLTYREMTGGSVTADRGGRTVIAEIQGVLWSIPRGGGRARQLTDWSLEATRPALSPDGKTIAVCGYRGGGFHVWTLRSDGGGLRRVTDGPWDDRSVAWSPDGRRLVLSSERGGSAVHGSAYGLWTLEPDTGRLEQVTGGAFDDIDPVWWPDGESLVCVRAAHRTEGDGGRTLVRVSVTSGEATVLHSVRDGRLLAPAVSPSGRVACLHLSGTGDSPSLPAARTTLLVDGQAVSRDEDIAAAPPCWLDDDRLLYGADGRIRSRALGTGAVQELPFTARLSVPRAERKPKSRPDSGTRVPVRGIHRPVLSPDGRRAAFVALNALWSLPLGGAPRKLLQGAPEHHLQMPAWAPDGDSLLYCSDRDGLIAVRRLHLADDRDELVADGGRIQPALSPDGSRLACQDVTGTLLVRDLASGAERVIARPLATDGPPGTPTWSPDGRYLAFCDRNRLNHRFREGYHLIRVIDTLTGGERRHLPADHQSLSDRVAAGPVWSPDGRWMALVAESALWALPVTAAGAPAGPPRRLTDEPADHPSWAGDSRGLLYLSCGRLRLLGLDDNGAPRRTRTLPATYLTPRPGRAGGATERLRIHAGQLWDATGDGVRQDVDILVHGNRITAVEPHRPRRAGHRTIDASAQTVIPGLFDSHTHPYTATYGARLNLTALAYGVTTTACLGAPLYEAVRLRESGASGHSLGPRQLACAELIDGARTAYSMGRAHRTAAGVERTLRRATALDVDFVKTYVRACGDVMARAATAAHRLGVPCGSHLCSPGRTAGQDLTTHLQATQRLPHGHATTPQGHIHQDLVEQYADGSFGLIITPFSAQALLGSDPALADDPRVRVLMPPWDVAAVDERAKTPPTAAQRRQLAAEMANYRQLRAHGARLALGTDAPLVPAGLSMHLALRALHAHGFSAAQALRCATAAPARLFGLDDVGTVQAGKIADLVVVDGDPFTDFTTLVKTSLVLREGVPHRQSDLTAVHRAADGPPPRGTTWLEAGLGMRRGSCCDPGEDT
ncbi:PD40 domain-containing protein [Streptomyces sp. G44]|uniref:amidohydrolase family protein n=1 Tax=Streptomyces sp. G44 TaxID=2807632 RepID=UPI00196023AF|nr:amidohydrolase family protein [Streptomyces sp. G44]MBM7168666.1 PD40 domain-containing protein [Streptomyces sp. G44]